MKVLLVGLIIENVGPTEKKIIFVQVDDNARHRRFDFPGGVPWNHGQIIKYLGEQLGVPPGEIVWPAHIQVPSSE